MYIPEHFRSRHHNDAIRFMQSNPFAILISMTNGEPFATHLPVVLRPDADPLLIRGHVAKANPHWRHLEQHPQCLTIFHGPHAYISPGLYATRESVPTWNYGAVHVYGNARVLASQDSLQGVLDDLIATFDASYATHWSELSPAYRERMLSHIVGFEIAATRIEAKFKLSQNRTKEEQAKVIAALENSGDTAISGVARLMREQMRGIKKE